MLEILAGILLVGFFVGRLFYRLQIPALVGMVCTGMLLGRSVSGFIPEGILQSAGEFRAIAVMVILMKAGLGLDYEKLRQQGTVALRLGFLPAICEAMVVAVVAIWLLHFDFATGLMLGCILGAESPAVIVPAMLRLKSLGWGVSKGIPDAVLTGSALSDVLLLLVFNLLLAFSAQQASANLWLLPVQVLSQIVFGVGIGWLTALVLISLLTKQNWTQNLTQDTLITAVIALLLVKFADKAPFYSGYLAVMALGFFIIQLDSPLARRLRSGFDSLWQIAEIFLFVLLGASIPLTVLSNNWQVGLLIIAVGTLVGRSLGWYLSTLGSNWNTKERLFLLPANSAKATVQAAIGAIPLAQGINGGAEILAISALSILVTAPLGAWAIPTFAPLLLQKGTVDPTKVAVGQKMTLLVAVDTSSLAPVVLSKSAELARMGDGEIIALYVQQSNDPQGLAWLEATVRQMLADIRHRFLVVDGSPVATILNTAAAYRATGIVMGKRGHSPLEQVVVGSISQAVLESSPIPVTIVEGA
jgi:NhaP-type Na+/H+ or K+/H+ antiporter/nucleotide-binding universal stress UspA family protein